jgi:hypothetical protein
VGRGFLRDFDRHVKAEVGTLLELLDRHDTEPVVSYLIQRAHFSGTAHYGMPRWPQVVCAVRAVLADPDHEQWHGHGRDWLAKAPEGAPPPAQLCEALFTAPEELPLDVLQWLTNGPLGCAGAADSLEAEWNPPGAHRFEYMFYHEKYGDGPGD